MTRHQTERYNKMIAARRNEQAKNLLRDAPRLLDELDQINRTRGSILTEVLLHTRADIAALLRRKDLPMIERASLIEMNLRNICARFNEPATRNGRLLVDLIGEIDPADTHFGPARIWAQYAIKQVSEREYFAPAHLATEAA
jgi:BMFP domain-containing protein YqiC